MTEAATGRDPSTSLRVVLSLSKDDNGAADRYV